jgi:two-component system response regulator NreC
MSDRIRVLIVDDHVIVRSGLRMLLEAEAGIDVVGEAADGDKALELVEKHAPDLVLMDIAMPGMDGMEATCQSKPVAADQSLVLTMHRSDEYFFEMFEAASDMASAEISDLIQAVRAVAGVGFSLSCRGSVDKGYLDLLG